MVVSLMSDTRHGHYTEEDVMSEPSNTRPEVPEGESKYVKTRQMKANEKGFVGYETEWEEFHKVIEYKTPEAP